MITLCTFPVDDRNAVLRTRPAFPCSLQLVVEVDWPQGLWLDGLRYSKLAGGEFTKDSIGLACRYISERTQHEIWLALDGRAWCPGAADGMAAAYEIGPIQC